MTQEIQAENQQQALEIACYFLRQCSCAHIRKLIRQAETAEAVGPLIHPTAWAQPNAFKQHSANLDALRRALDLRQALIAVDETFDVGATLTELPT